MGIDFAKVNFKEEYLKENYKDNYKCNYKGFPWSTPLSCEAFKIGSIAVSGILNEVGISPSPGLVSPFSMGSHDDMDFFLFLKSTSFISPAMYLCAQAGLDNEIGLLEKIREIGLYFEGEMFRATNGVNTQKGLLFLAGVICASAGLCIRKNLAINRLNISGNCRIICSGIVERELKNLKRRPETNGEKLFVSYGISGIRGEVEGGIPTVLNFGLPALEDGFKNGLNLNDSLVHSLVYIMSEAIDTTVINRCGMEGLNYMKNSALKALSLGGMLKDEGRRYIEEMDISFKERKISPGGAADLLSATSIINYLEAEYS